MACGATDTCSNRVGTASFSFLLWRDLSEFARVLFNSSTSEQELGFAIERMRVWLALMDSAWQGTVGRLLGQSGGFLVAHGLQLLHEERLHG